MREIAHIAGWTLFLWTLLFGVVELSMSSEIDRKTATRTVAAKCLQFSTAIVLAVWLADFLVTY